MHLVIFDIDGTLTNTNHVDHLCYFEAVSTLNKVDVTKEKWEDFKHFTDSNITNELYERLQGHLPTSEQLALLYAEVKRLYDENLKSNPSFFDEVKGAKAFIEELERNENYVVAFATGCWKFTAQYKLNIAEIPYDEAVLANADNNISREDILQDAIQLAVKKYKTASFESITYFGDGSWDFKTCKNLNVPLIGIDCNNRNVLQPLGVPFVFKDYTDRGMIYEAMRNIRK